MICGFIIPSRKRFDRLLRTIESIHRSARDMSEVEILVKFDYDDDEASERFLELSKFTNTRLFFDRRCEHENMTGYASISQAYNRLMRLSEARWLWMFNDDCLLEGDWQTELEELPSERNYVHPWRIQTRVDNWYDENPIGPFPVIRKADFDWTKDRDTIRDPIDADIVKIYQLKGEPPAFLHGVIVTHERDEDSILALHRI